MHRFRAQAGSLALVVALLFGPALPARAAEQSLWFAGRTLIFQHSAENNGDLAVSVRDPGLTGFLARLGATVAWSPGQRYIVVTSGDRRTVTLTVGDARITSGGGSTTAPFAPYLDGGEAIVPFYALARALYVEPVKELGETVLQPQLSVLDVRQQGLKTVVTVRAASPLRFHKLADSTEQLAIAFNGVASTLPADQPYTFPGLSGVSVSSTGHTKNPTATLTFTAPKDSVHALYPSTSPNELVLVFAQSSVTLAGSAVPADFAGAAVAAPAAALPRAAMPPNVPPPPPTLVGSAPSATAVPPAGAGGSAAAVPTGTTVTGVAAQAGADQVIVRIDVSGPAAYEWHRLADNRYYVDIKNATLVIPSRDDAQPDSLVQSLRFRQLNAAPTPTVRVALTLTGDRRVELTTAETSLTLTVSAAPSDALRAGAGTIGTPPAGSSVAAAPQPSDDGSGTAPSGPPGWKFGAAQPAGTATAPPPPPGSNPRLIVIDPGHGGSDTGAAHNGLVEKNLTLDISQRLRSLLVAQGWQVRMTRTTDVDVVAPNDDAKTELQGRCDIGNNLGARLFISVHINSFTTAALNGTTTYYYKTGDNSFAAAVHRHLMALLPTKDDGVRRENFYVVRHTTMPAILVETAFLSNPTDAEYLKTPSFLQNVAQGIADGVKEYAGLPGSQARSVSDR